MYCKELNKTFECKKDMFKALKESKDEIIGLKKSAIKMSTQSRIIFKAKEGVKADTDSKLELGDSVKVAMNTTNYFDFDKDVLLSGSWSKSAKEQNGKTYHVINHDLKIGSIIAYPKDVEVSVETHKWKDLGKGFEGETDVLVFKSKMTDKTNKDAFLAYKDGEDVEHSIRLQYIKIELAFKSDETEDKEENALYLKYYPQIANKEDVDKDEYFWAVTEAKIYKEGSMVLFGANDATPQLENKTEPIKSHSKKTEPSEDTQEEFYEFLITNLKKK